jgi:hypothetical protein
MKIRIAKFNLFAITLLIMSAGCASTQPTKQQLTPPKPSSTYVADCSKTWTVSIALPEGTSGVNNFAMDHSGGLYFSSFLMQKGGMGCGTAGGFVAKYSDTGELEWKIVPGNYSPQGQSLCVDDEDNVYIAGGFRARVDLDPGPEEHIFQSRGYMDAFLLSLDKNGKYRWAKTWGGPERSGVTDIPVDGDCVRWILYQSGSIIVGGEFPKSIDFGSPKFQPVKYAYGGIFLMRLNTDGVVEDAKAFETDNIADLLHGVLDNEGNLVLAGSAAEAIHFTDILAWPVGHDGTGYRAKLDRTFKTQWVNFLPVNYYSDLAISDEGRIALAVGGFNGYNLNYPVHTSWVDRNLLSVFDPNGKLLEQRPIGESDEVVNVKSCTFDEHSYIVRISGSVSPLDKDYSIIPGKEQGLLIRAFTGNGSLVEFRTDPAEQCSIDAIFPLGKRCGMICGSFLGQSSFPFENAETKILKSSEPGIFIQKMKALPEELRLYF